MPDREKVIKEVKDQIFSLHRISGHSIVERSWKLQGNTSGSENMVALPGSGITIRVPLVRYTMSVKPLAPGDRGVIPEFIFYPTISDLAEQKDVQLEYALSIVEKN